MPPTSTRLPNPMKTLPAGLFVVCSFVLALAVARAAEPAWQLTNSESGPAKIEGEDASYYYFRAKIASKSGSAITFKADTCRLLGQDKQAVTDCWIGVVGAAAGVSESKTAPIAMRTYAVTHGIAKPDTAPRARNTAKVDGPDGAIEYTIPKDGFVELYFLWPVPKGFQPRRVVLQGIAESALPVVVR